MALTIPESERCRVGEAGPRHYNLSIRVRDYRIHNAAEAQNGHRRIAHFGRTHPLGSPAWRAGSHALHGPALRCALQAISLLMRCGQRSKSLTATTPIERSHHFLPLILSCIAFFASCDHAWTQWLRQLQDGETCAREAHRVRLHLGFLRRRALVIIVVVDLLLGLLVDDLLPARRSRA